MSEIYPDGTYARWQSADIEVKAEIKRLSTRASALEALLAECETVLTGIVRSRIIQTSNYNTDMAVRARALLAKLKARTSGLPTTFDSGGEG